MSTSYVIDVEEKQLGAPPLADQLKLYREQLQKEGTHHLKKVVQALEEGYAEIVLGMKEGWETGYPCKDPRPSQYPQCSIITLAVIVGWALIIGLFSLWRLGFSFFIQGEGHFVLGAFLLFIIAGLACATVFGTEIWFQERLGNINNRALWKKGVSARAGVPLLFLKQSLPSHVAVRVDRARECGLFDAVRVYAPSAAFKRVFLGDPIIFGEIDGQTFLIAQFNLGEDLAA